MNIVNDIPAFGTIHAADEYCRNKLLGMSDQYGVIIKNGTSRGGSEEKEIQIPTGHKIVTHWAQFETHNEKGNKVNRTFYVRAFYSVN